MIVIHFISVRYKTMWHFFYWNTTMKKRDFLFDSFAVWISYILQNYQILISQTRTAPSIPQPTGGEGDSETESTGHPVTLEAQNHFLLRCATPIYPCPNKLIFWSGNIKCSKQWKYHVSYFLKYLCIFWTFFLRILLPLRWDRRQKTPEMNELETNKKTLKIWAHHFEKQKS